MQRKLHEIIKEIVLVIKEHDGISKTNISHIDTYFNTSNIAYHQLV